MTLHSSAWGAALLLLVTALGGCAHPIPLPATPPPVPLASNEVELAKIAELRARMEEANNNGDLTAIMKCYAEDAGWVHPKIGMIEGRAQIAPYYESSYGQTDLEVELISEETVANGSWGFDRGTTRVRQTHRATGQSAFRQERYLMIVRRFEDGEWRLWRLWRQALEE